MVLRFLLCTSFSFVLLLSDRGAASTQEASKLEQILDFIINTNIGENIVDEDNYDYVFKMERQTFLGQKDFQIHFIKFGIKKGEKGSIVVSPGRKESALKYSEVAYDLMKMGFSPIFIIDHRGQGFSTRILDDPEKGYVEDFSFYYDDFNKFTNIVLNDESVDRDNLFLLAHSMGGAIATGYLQKYPQQPFKAVVLLSPMIGIRLNAGERASLAWIFVKCKILRRCLSYVGDEKSDTPKNNKFTTSEEHYSFWKALWDHFPQLRIGRPIYHWVGESISANRRMREVPNLLKINHIPILLLQAGKDEIVDNNHSSKFCSRLPLCKSMKFSDAKHELLMEKDDTRNLALEEIEEFFSPLTLEIL